MPSRPFTVPSHLNATELIVADLPPRAPILEPILAQKSLAMLYGPRGLGKTFMALGIAWAAAAGESFLKWRASRPHRVLYIDGEMAAVDMKERLRLLGSAPPMLDFLIADLEPDALPDLAHTDSQVKLWKSWGKTPDLVVLDNLSSLVGFRRNDPDSWTNVQRWLMAMRRAGIAVLVVHHANKSGDQRGTSRREDVLDVVMAMRRPGDYEPQDGARFEIHFEKARGLVGDAAEPIEARMAMDSIGVMRWDWRPAHLGQLDRVVALLQDGLNPKQVAKELGCSTAKSYRLRKRAVEMGLLAASGR
jgi:putative DNA primase/helicase